MQPVRTSRRFIGEARELRLDPCWRMGRLGTDAVDLTLAAMRRVDDQTAVRFGIGGYQGKA